MSEIVIARQMAALERNLHDRALAAITELRRLSVRHADTIVVTVPANTTYENCDHVRDVVRRITGHTRVLVVDRDVEISVAERGS